MPRPWSRAVSAAASTAVSAAVSVVVSVAVVVVPAGSALAAPPPTPDFSRPVDPYSTYQGQTGCAAVPSPGILRLQQLVLAAYPASPSRGYLLRSCDTPGTSEHEDGRAWDWPARVDVPEQKAMADELLAWLTAPDDNGVPNARMRRLGIMYMIYNRQIFKAYGSPPGWYAYTGENPHTDHIHFSLSWEGARETTSWGLRTDAPTPGIALHGGGLTWVVRDPKGTPQQGLWQPGTGPTSLGSPGGVLVGGLGVTRLADGSLVAAGRGRDDALYVTRRPPGAAWQDWRRVAERISSRPALVGNAGGGFDMAVRGDDDRLWTASFAADLTQTPWTSAGSPVMLAVSAPGITYTAGQRLEQVVLAADGWPWRRTRTGTAWTAWTRIPGGQFQGDVSLAGSSDGLVLAMRGLNDQGYVRTLGASDTGWVGLGGVLSSSPGVAAEAGAPRADVVIYGRDGQLWRTTGSGRTWSQWAPIGRV